MALGIRVELFQGAAAQGSCVQLVKTLTVVGNGGTHTHTHILFTSASNSEAHVLCTSTSGAHTLCTSASNRVRACAAGHVDIAICVRKVCRSLLCAVYVPQNLEFDSPDQCMWDKTCGLPNFWLHPLICHSRVWSRNDVHMHTHAHTRTHTHGIYLCLCVFLFLHMYLQMHVHMRAFET